MLILLKKILSLIVVCSSTVLLFAGCATLTGGGKGKDVSEFVESTGNGNKGAKYIQSIANVAGLNYAKVEAVGLVSGLGANGSNPPPSWHKDQMMDELKTHQNLRNAAEILADKDTSIVSVRAMIPPAARVGDPVDLEIVLPPKSETKSLRNGYLSAVRLKPLAVLSKQLREGRTLATGKGFVVVESVFESRNDAANDVRGWVPGGGVVTEDRPLALILRSDEQTPKLVTQVSNAINDRFTINGRNGREGVAKAKTGKQIELQVPASYRNNIGRYVEIVQSITFDESESQKVERLEILDKQIDHPAMCKLAAMRLEALGEVGVPALRRALQNPDEEVCFHAAQALAYMGYKDGVEILRNAAESEPAFRWNALAALTSLADPEATTALFDLMNVESSEARYGAFQSMYISSPNDPRIRGEEMPNGFRLHVVPGTASSMLHISRRRRPEIVIFNDNQFVSRDIMLVDSGITVRSDGSDGLELIKYTRDGESRLRCSRRVSDVVRTLGNAGCNYSTVVSMLRQLKQQEDVDSRLVVEALPRLGRVYERETLVAEDKSGKSNRFLPGNVPDMFRMASSDEEASIPHDDAAAIERAADIKPAKKTLVQRLKSAFTSEK